MSDNEPLTPGKVSRAWNSRPVFIGAAIVIAIAVLVVGAATITALTSPKDGNHAETAPTSSGKPATQAGGRCSVAVGDTSSTPTMPNDLTFKTGIDGLSWPVSKSVGPTSTVDGFDACFARSPLGAALAATTAIYSQYESDHTPAAALDFYIANSAGKAANIAGTVKNTDPAQMRASGLNPAGFIVDSFTKEQAQITLVSSYPSSPTGFAGTPCTVVWVKGDWKLSVLDNGELSAGSATTPSQGDFVAWGGKKQ